MALMFSMAANTLQYLKGKKNIFRKQFQKFQNL